MRAPVAMEKHLGQRPPRIAESNTEGLQQTSLHSQTPRASYPSRSTASLDVSPEAQIIGRVPFQFAGVTNGESLWALPNQQSPEASSDSNSVAGQSAIPVTDSGIDDLMADIDWVN